MANYCCELAMSDCRYFLYVLLAAILGSLVSRIEDMNQTLMPLTLLAMIAFYIAIFSIMKPDMLLTKITSFIPFLAPFELLVRSQSSDLDIWEIIVSMGLSVIVIILLLWIAVKHIKILFSHLRKDYLNLYIDSLKINNSVKPSI